MPRNLLKSFPTAMLRRGLAHVHPRGAAPIPAPEPHDREPARLELAPFDLVPEPPLTLLLIVPDLPAVQEIDEETAILAAA